MGLKLLLFLCFVVGVFAKDCPSKRINTKLICYYSKLKQVDPCFCTHVIVPANTDFKLIDDLKGKLTGTKVLLTVNEFNQDLLKAVKKKSIDGLEINLKKLDSKDDISEFINTARSRLGNDLYLAVSVPPKAALLAKYYDMKTITKLADLFILQTSFLGSSKNVTFHPSRLSGLWDMQNTDSVVDLVTGLGAPLSKLVISVPVQAFKFTLQDETLTTPGSPALEIKSLTRSQLCEKMSSSNDWTLERDQDQAGPYIFRGTEWISFEDPTSIDIKAKYARVRGLSGLALKDVSQDDDSEKCGGSLLSAAYAGLSKQTRAPRQAVLRSLEREILETPAGPLNTIHVSPYRISRVIDVEGHVHTIRKDTRTEFQCSRQGYFVHPKSCARFYRCVKFDQHSDEFSVFEFDCPAGLAFDERVEVCVWPGSLPDGAPCSGSSEIAPVPRERFACPAQTGYYADPENCRWFFACLDHGKSGLTAYEFRCPFGLVFDEKNLLCEWPWLVPTCKSGDIYGLGLESVTFYGGGKNVGVQLQKTGGLATDGGYFLENYDGLGQLGAVSLGGLSGDLNLLKNSQIGLAQHGLGSGLGQGGAVYTTTQHGQGQGQLISGGHLKDSGALSGGQQGLVTGTVSFGADSGLQSGAQFEGNQAYGTYGSGATLQQELDQLKLDLNTFISDSKLQDANANRGSLQYTNIGLGGAGLKEVGQGVVVDHGSVNTGDVTFVTAGLPQTTLVEEGKLSTISQSHGGQDYGKQVGGGATSYVKINHDYKGGQVGTGSRSYVLNSGGNVHLSSPTGFAYQRGLGGKVLYETNDNADVINGKLNLGTAGFQTNVGHTYDNNNQGYVLATAGIKSNLGSVQYSDNSERYISNPELLSLGHGGATSSVEFQKSVEGVQPALVESKFVGLSQGSGGVATSVEQGPGAVLQGAKLLNEQLLSTVHGQSDSVGSAYYNNQYANDAKFVQPIISQTFTTHGQSVGGHSDRYNADTVVLNTPKLQYNVQQHVTGPTEASLTDATLHAIGGESAKNAAAHYTSSYLAVTPKTNLLKLSIDKFVTPSVQQVPVVQSAKSHSQFYSQPLQASKLSVQEPVAVIHQTSVTPKPDQIVTIQQQPEYIQTVTAAPVSTSHVYSTHSQKSSIQHHQPSLEVISATPKPDQILTIQPQYVETVTAAPKQQTHFYTKKIHQAPEQVVTVQEQPQVNVNFYEKQHQPVLTKSEQIITYQQPKSEQVFIQHQKPQLIQTASPKYDTQFYGKQIEQVSTIQHQPISVGQKSEQILIQQPQFIQTVTESPKYDTNFYGKQVQVSTVEHQQPIKSEQVFIQHQAPQYIKTVTETPNYNTQFYGEQIQQISTGPKSESVFIQHQQPQYIKTVTESPKINTQFYVKKVDEVSAIHHQPVETVSIAPKAQEILIQHQEPQYVQTVSESPKYSTQYFGKHVQHVEHQPIETVSEQVLTVQQPQVHLTDNAKYNSQFYSKQEHVSNVEHQPIETVSVAPKSEQILIQHQPQYIQTVTESPKYNTQFFTKVEEQPRSEQVVTIHQQPQYVKTVTESPKYSQFYSKQEHVSNVEHQPIETVSAAPKSEQILIQHQPQFIQTVTESPKYNTQFFTKVEEQPRSEQVVTIHQQPQYVKTVTESPKYSTQFYAKEVQSVTPKSQQFLNIHLEPQVIKTEDESLHIQSVTPKYQSQNLKISTVHQGGFEVPSIKTSAPIYQEQQLVLKQENAPSVSNFGSQFYGKQVQENVQAQEDIKPVGHFYDVYSPVSQTKLSFGEVYSEPTKIKAYQKQTPTVVESYTYTQPKEVKVNIDYDSREYLPPQTTYVSSTQKPIQYVKTKAPEVFVSTTPKYAVFQEFVQPKQTFEIQQKIQPAIISQYKYENPDFVNYKTNLNFDNEYEFGKSIEEVPFTAKVVSYSSERPIVSSTPAVKNYQTEYILSTPKPTFVSTLAPVLKQTPRLRAKVVEFRKYNNEDVVGYVENSTPAAPSLPSGSFYYYDSRYKNSKTTEDTPIVEDLSYFQPQVNIDYEEEQRLINAEKYALNDDLQRKTITTGAPLHSYRILNEDYNGDYAVTTYKPSLATTVEPDFQKIVSTTTGIPFETVISTTIKPSTYRGRLRQKVATSTIAPDVTYDYDYSSTLSYIKPKITATTRPVVKKKKILTTTTLAPTEESYEDEAYLVSSEKPVEIVKIITPKPKGKTIVRVNDFHPFLTTKLGAQCTCVSNPIKIRKGKTKAQQSIDYDYDLSDNIPVTKITSTGPTSYDDYQEPGVYVVGNTDSYDYDYEPQKISATVEPEFDFKSTTNAVRPAPTPVYVAKKRITSVSPLEVSSVAYIPEVEIGSTVKPVSRKKSKEEKIAQAVNEGLSLVKSAIKGYVDEAIESHKFDRYGPGGWRSRDETLQGTVDCQRAGLFRHPTQCNKFYACHWDCTKQRYTLHVFNCPVHLTFDTTMGACNWPSKGPACSDNTLLPNV